MRHLDLFSGIGGFALAARMVGGIETVGFVEIDPFCRKVLANHWPGVWQHDDMRTLQPDALPHADIWTGGFPCQDISIAGRGAGLSGTRSGLFFEIVRLLHGVRRRPAWLLLENVPCLRTRGYDRVKAEVERAGYAVTPLVVGAWAVGAPHKRNRVWIVAHLDAARLPKQQRQKMQGRRGTGPDRISLPTDWGIGHPSETFIRRGVHGIPGRVDRIKALGNSIVPQVAAVVMRAMRDVSEDEHD